MPRHYQSYKSIACKNDKQEHTKDMKSHIDDGSILDLEEYDVTINVNSNSDAAICQLCNNKKKNLRKEKIINFLFNDGEFDAHAKCMMKYVSST